MKSFIIHNKWDIFSLRQCLPALPYLRKSDQNIVELLFQSRNSPTGSAFIFIESQNILSWKGPTRTINSWPCTGKPQKCLRPLSKYSVIKVTTHCQLIPGLEELKGGMQDFRSLFKMLFIGSRWCSNVWAVGNKSLAHSLFSHSCRFVWSQL